MAMKTTEITITFSKTGVQPPVHLAGSFSDPAWQPKLMQYTIGPDKQYRFHAEIYVDSGSSYQYKFRVGEGGWWLLDENSPTVTDDQGNRNNLLVVPQKNKIETLDSRSSTNRPALVVEKTGVEPRHGDDFGDSATLNQKEAQRMRSQDAEPDQIIVIDDAAKESANTAADVADAAALLDVEQSTPPISDAEAGRIGLRRLSQTPIAEVAAVASEVSDSAALLDKDDLPLRLEMPSSFIVDGGSAEAETPGSGEVTPWEERVPRFAHECVQPPNSEVKPAQPPEVQQESSEEDERNCIDPNDPSIEDFPCERHLILERVKTSATRLSEDETVWQALSQCPVAGGDQPEHPERSERPEQSESSSSSPGRVAGEVRTPPLDSIPEEHSYTGDGFSVLPGTMHMKYNQSESGSLGYNQHEALATHNEEPELTAEPYEPNSVGSQPRPKLTKDTVPIRASSQVGIQGTTCETWASEEFHPDLRNIGAGQTKDGAHAEGEYLQSLPTKLDYTNQVVSDKMGDGVGERGGLGWSSTVSEQETPASSLRARSGYLPDLSASNSTTSCARGGSGLSPLSSSKAMSPLPERSVTPSSMRSANLIARSRELLKSFLRLLFVDWIGGLIKRLCGRRRRTDATPSREPLQ